MAFRSKTQNQSGDLNYIGGSFYRICDISGFKVRSFDTKKVWNGTIARKQSWEPRQPQDFVRGVPDDQSAPEPRPRSPNIFVDVTTAITSNYAPLAQNIAVQSVVGLQVGNRIGITLDDGAPWGFWFTTIEAIAGLTLLITPTLGWFASNGNQVTLYPNQSQSIYGMGPVGP